jgi:protein-tyrosine phosphatase
MIDLHCHVLPGLDDGARDLDDAIAMARQAQADGIELICATPHIRHDHDVRIGELAERVAELNGELELCAVAVRVATGGEVAEPACRRLGTDELARVALGGGGRWILLEPAPGPLGDRLLDGVESLAQRGYRSVIAHPERHQTADLGERLAALVRRGALVQGTAEHVVDPASAEGMLSLARRGVLHVLGSDAHSSRAGRPVRLAAALERLTAIAPLAPHAEWIRSVAPRAIVAGEELEPPFAPA